MRRSKLAKLPPAITRPRTDRFTIVYTGSLYPQFQSLSPLVGAINALVERGAVLPQDLQLIYRGKDRGVWEE